MITRLCVQKAITWKALRAWVLEIWYQKATIQPEQEQKFHEEMASGRHQVESMSQYARVVLSDTTELQE